MDGQGGKNEKDRQFEEILKDYEKMIYHLIHKYQIKDPHGEFFQEGMVALWKAYERYWGRDTFGKLAYITIRSRLIDLIRKKTRTSTHEMPTDFINESAQVSRDIESFDPYFWASVKAQLTEKQWTFVKLRIVDGLPLKEIASAERTTVDAVKGWGKEVRRKLKTIIEDENIL